jgi:RHS repeat-associated protein
VGGPEGAEELAGESYVFDAFGNLTSRTTVTSAGGSSLATPADPSTNRLTGAVTYDAEGNVRTWNAALYDFDALGRMTRMRSGAQDWLFGFTAGGERIVQIGHGGLGEKRWTWRDLAGRVLREWREPASGAPEWTRDWVYRGGQLLAVVDQDSAAPNGERQIHFTLDHLGTPRLITDETGVKIASHTYWPFGREASDPSQNSFQMKYTGHERDAYDESSTSDDLDYMHARFYNPIVARMASMDSAGIHVGSPQSFNRYAYVQGNPMLFHDPTGLTNELASSEPPLDGYIVVGADDVVTDFAEPWKHFPGLFINWIGWQTLENPGARYFFGGLGDFLGRKPEDKPDTPDPPKGPHDNPDDKKFLYCIGKTGNFGLGGPDVSKEALGYRYAIPGSDGLIASRYTRGTYDAVHGYGPWDFPGGTYLIAHTHPRERGPEPSSRDRRIADLRPGVHMYSIHAGGVWMYHSGMRSPVKVLRSGWEKEFKGMTAAEACAGAKKD